MKKSTWIIGIMVLCIWSLPGHLQAEEALNIGMVNLRQIFAEFEDVEKSSKVLKGEVEKQQEIIDRKKTEITTLTEELDKQEIILSKEEKEKSEEIIDAKVKALQDFVIEVNQSIKSMENKIKKEIIDRILEAVQAVGEEEKYDLILEQNDKIVLFSVPRFDITEKVLRKLKVNN